MNITGSRTVIVAVSVALFVAIIALGSIYILKDKEIALACVGVEGAIITGFITLKAGNGTNNGNGQVQPPK